jgi:hypothetical protein
LPGSPVSNKEDQASATENVLLKELLNMEMLTMEKPRHCVYFFVHAFAAPQGRFTAAATIGHAPRISS